MAVFRTDEVQDADLEVASLEQASSVSGNLLRSFLSATVAVFMRQLHHQPLWHGIVAGLGHWLHSGGQLACSCWFLAAVLKPVRSTIVRFSRRKPLAAVGAIIIILAVTTDVYADYLAPHDPRGSGRRQVRGRWFRPAGSSAGLGPRAPH